VVFRDLLARESLAPPWRDLLVALRRLEARGEIRGGRFVAGFVGEQFALPQAVDALRAVRRSKAAGERAPATQDAIAIRLGSEHVVGAEPVIPSEHVGERFHVAASDPLNLLGIVSPGPRISVLAGQTVDLLPPSFQPRTAQAI
jgi:ATP-dependent Lhr-like helicase